MKFFQQLLILFSITTVFSYSLEKLKKRYDFYDPIFDFNGITETDFYLKCFGNLDMVQQYITECGGLDNNFISVEGVCKPKCPYILKTIQEKVKSCYVISDDLRKYIYNYYHAHATLYHLICEKDENGDSCAGHSISNPKKIEFFEVVKDTCQSKKCANVIANTLENLMAQYQEEVNLISKKNKDSKIRIHKEERLSEIKEIEEYLINNNCEANTYLGPKAQSDETKLNTDNNNNNNNNNNLNE